MIDTDTREKLASLEKAAVSGVRLKPPNILAAPPDSGMRAARGAGSGYAGLCMVRDSLIFVLTVSR